MKISAFSAIALAALAFTAMPAAAQEWEPAGGSPGAAGALDIRVEAALLSDYRYRGISRSDEDPALQAALLVGHPSGFYAGVRATSLKGQDPFRLRAPGLGDLGDAQFDLHAGYGTGLGAGFELDAGVEYHVFAGGEGATDYVEPYASLSYLIGPVYATAGAKFAPAASATGDEEMLYLFGQADIAIPFRPWRFSALVGHQDWGIYGSYWTWSLGVERQLRLGGLGQVDIGLSYVDTDLPPISGQDAGLVGSLRLRF